MIQGDCPQCKSEKIFQTPFRILPFSFAKMHDDCPKCHHHYETEPGFFIGAMYMSYALTVAQLGIIYVLLTLTELTVDEQAIIMLVVVFTSAFFNYRYSRILWIYSMYRDSSKYEQEEEDSEITHQK